MNPTVKLDHIVIGAKSLSEGIDFVRGKLGVDIPFGGEHLTMGTHNHLMQLGDGVFLEVIAVNENIEPPKQPRWYGLDDPYIRQSLETGPKLLAWVVNTQALNKLIEAATFSLGHSELIRRGDLSWNFAVPEDGRLLASGLLPYAIEWHTDIHPSQRMADLGCSLKSLQIYHPYPRWLKQALDSILASELVNVYELQANDTPYFSVEINTPSGTVELQSG